MMNLSGSFCSVLVKPLDGKINVHETRDEDECKAAAFELNAPITRGDRCFYTKAPYEDECKVGKWRC